MNALTITAIRGRPLRQFERPTTDVASRLLRLVVHAWAAATATIALHSRAHSTASQVVTAADDNADARFQRDIVSQLDAAYNFARFLSRDADASHDIVQEAFLRAYRRFDGYQGGDARAWIFAIVRNCYQDWLLARRRKGRLEVDARPRDGMPAQDPAEVAADDDDPETALLRQSQASAVRRVLNSLPRQLREILVLREIESLSYKQIAEVSSLPIGTVMSRLARARAQFQIAWGQAPGQESEA